MTPTPQTDARWEEELREASEQFVTCEADGCETLQACFEAGARWAYSEAFAQVAAEAASAARDATLEEVAQFLGFNPHGTANVETSGPNSTITKVTLTWDREAFGFVVQSIRALKSPANDCKQCGGRASFGCTMCEECFESSKSGAV